MPSIHNLARPPLLALLAAAALLLVACSGGNSKPDVPPTSKATISATVRTIEASTQMHLSGVGIGVGNIWAEDYQEEGSSKRVRGLTAAMSISVENQPASNRTLRVHPGQEVDVQGYKLKVVAVDKNSIQVDVITAP